MVIQGGGQAAGFELRALRGMQDVFKRRRDLEAIMTQAAEATYCCMTCGLNKVCVCVCVSVCVCARARNVCREGA